MSEQDGTLVVVAQRPTTTERDAWADYWKSQGQPWRTEPEIDSERQNELERYRAIIPDIRQGIYAFKNIVLNRADVEWLLITHQNGRGPIDWSDESQRTRVGLDLRGADLRKADLHNLPLARMRGAISWQEDPTLTEYQRHASVAEMGGADLKQAHLEGAMLSGVHLERADLREAHLEEAMLVGAHLEGAYLYNTHLERAFLAGAFFSGTYLWKSYWQGAVFRGAHMSDAILRTDITLADADGVGPHLIDVSWGNANLAVVNWSEVKILGSEYVAHQTEVDGIEKDEAVRLNEYIEAVRANRQLAVALQAQGLNEEASRFAYRAQILQRHVLRRQNKIGQYLFSGFLDMLAGYGYKPGRSLIAYLVLIFGFAIIYATLGHMVVPHISPLAAVIFSITSFHGRGFFPGGIPLDHPITVLAAMEAIMGLIIEISFIATFTQRFFAK